MYQGHEDDGMKVTLVLLRKNAIYLPTRTDIDINVGDRTSSRLYIRKPVDASFS